MEPKINVNLTQCPTWCRHNSNPTLDHFINCPGKPVPIPCAIPPKVEMVVRIGECICSPDFVSAGIGHSVKCPQRTIRVSCSISGKTWEESEANNLEWTEAMPYGSPSISAFMRPVRARWALVNALVLGKPREDSDGQWAGPSISLLAQRDAVYAALTIRRRHEIGEVEQDDVLRKLFPMSPVGPLLPQASASEAWLGHYSERLIEQVEKLS